MAETPSKDIVQSLAPGGTLRVAMNFGNTVLAQKDPATGEPRGVSAALAREVAKRLGVPIGFIGFDAAGKVVDALKTDAWDLAFLAIDPVRADTIDFSPPYVIIEGAYLVPKASPLQTVADVDRPGVRIAVGKGSAYELWLTRNLKHAELVRDTTGTGALGGFLKSGLEAAAGVKQPIVAFAKAHPETRVIPGRFMVIEQAMATPKGRAAGAAFIRSFIEEMKASGFVARALAESGQAEAAVAPPTPAR